MRILTFLVLSIFLVSCSPERPHVETIKLNREASKALQNENFQNAYEKYLSALSYDPFLSPLHLNLGLSLEALQQADKGLLSYQTAEKLAAEQQKPELLFMARFNQAQLLAKAKKVDEALAMYQKSLEVIPTSKEVKTNIELLTQSQEGGGEGEGENQEQQENKENKDQKDQQDQDKKDEKEKENEDKQKEEPKKFQNSPKYKPRPFDGKDLSEADVKKILGELKQQEERIRAEYNRKEVKEQPRDKDW